jgi:hypothetical protein
LWDIPEYWVIHILREKSESVSKWGSEEVCEVVNLHNDVSLNKSND